MPQISVIVPIYNVEKYLQRCIDSILAQTFTDYELILVDDGSPDNCGKICNQYALRDSRIKVIHQENAGASAARNSGLGMAEGEFVCFCDSDDYIDTDYFEVLYTTITEKNYDCVLINRKLIIDNGEIKISQYNKDEIYFDSEVISYNYLISNVLNNKIPWELWSMIVKKQIIDTYKIRLCETCENYAEDLCFLLMYLVHCKSIKIIDYAGYYYFQRDNTITSNAKNKLKLNSLNEVSYYFYNHLKRFPSEKIIKDYPIIHFYIMNNQYLKVLKRRDFKVIPDECKKIQNKKWYSHMITRFIFTKRYKIEYYNKDMTFDFKNLCFYTVHKNYKLFKFIDGLYYKLKKLFK